MNPTLYFHPLASYCWKALIALYEHDVSFDRRVIDLGDDNHRAELSALWPYCKFPVLRVGERVLAESSIIVEYLDHLHPDHPPLFPHRGLDVRLWDRVFDNHAQTPVQEIVLDRLTARRGDTSRARATLRTTYELVDRRLGATWLDGDAFTAADCAAAPALFYAATLEPFPSHLARLGAYFERLVARPSVARTLEEARPYFALYPFADAVPSRFR